MASVKPVRLLVALAALLALLCLRPLAAQDRFADLARVVTAELDQTRTPGAIVAVIEQDKIVYLHAFGVANIETGQPLTSDMTFPLASMTKMYTATALVSLAEEGKVDLQAPIGTYLQGLPARLATVTPHQMLSHTAGFRDDAGISNRGYDDSTIDELVRAYTDGIFFTDPGVVFSYANQGFNISGDIVAHVSGRRYSQVIQDRIFTPLGMSRSTFTLATAVTFPFSQTHGGPNGQAPAVIRPMAVQAPWPVGGMFSTMTDLSHYAVMFMNDGMYAGKQVIAANVVKRMATANAPIHSQVEGGQYGYGLETLQWRGVRLVEHGGTLAGSATDFVMVPDQHAAVIVFANRQSHLTRTVDAAIESVVTGLGPKPAAPKPLTLTADEAAEYVGRYSQAPMNAPQAGAQAGGQEVVRTEDGGIAFRNGNTIVPLTKIGKDVFLVQQPGFTDPLRVEFVRGADGKVAFMHHRLRAQKKA
jgi:CubicO group peptidase (beta-lactamase class C family)